MAYICGHCYTFATEGTIDRHEELCDCGGNFAFCETLRSMEATLTDTEVEAIERKPGIDRGRYGYWRCFGCNSDEIGTPAGTAVV